MPVDTVPVDANSHVPHGKKPCAGSLRRSPGNSRRRERPAWLAHAPPYVFLAKEYLRCQRTSAGPGRDTLLHMPARGSHPHMSPLRHKRRATSWNKSTMPLEIPQKPPRITRSCFRTFTMTPMSFVKSSTSLCTVEGAAVAEVREAVPAERGPP